MQVIDAQVNWCKGFTNNPILQVLVDYIPKLSEMTFQRHNNIYYAENDGYVIFYYYKSPGEGFGGGIFNIFVEGEGWKSLKGPWSSRAGVMNMVGFGPCVDVSMTTDHQVMKRGYTFFGGAAITLDKAKDASKLAGVELERKELGGFSPATDMHQSKAVGGPRQEFIYVPAGKTGPYSFPGSNKG